MAASSNKEASLAHRLLVELLAYQFAFPVRWIETQEHILGTAGTAQRLVEIGPSQVLTPMAKKTAAKTFTAHDKTHPVRREFLSHNDHADQIFYQYSNQDSGEPPAPEEEEKEAEAPAPAASAPAPAAEAAPAPAPAPVAAAPPPPSGGGAPVSDKELSATDVVVSLTAQKLKLPFDQLALSKSIRDLSAGKSTLQNELIGIFAAEFGETPNGAEDLSLEALGEGLSGKFGGAPGKQMAALISKMVSAKMPSGFNAAAMKSHMESHWGLPKERQAAVICYATTMEPAARIGDEKAGKDWLDSVVGRYGKFEGISLSPGAGASAGAAAGGGMVAVDAESLKAAKEEQQRILRAQLKVLQKHLQDDSQLDTKQTNDLLNALHAHEEKLAQWGVEFDDDFFNGVKAIFDPTKARHYDSWWNWAREDVITLLHGISTGQLTTDTPETMELLSSIRNRLNPSCEELLRIGASRMTESGLDVLLRRESIISGVPRPRYSYHARSLGPSTSISEAGEIQYKELPRTKPDGSDAGTYSQIVRDGCDSKSLKMHIPYAHIRTRVHGDWAENAAYTTSYMDALDRGMHEGLTFAGKTALVTGAGPNSIGADIVKGLLTGGANVLVTTSREPSASAEFYQKMYRDVAGPGASLKVLPFNAASRKDCDTLIDYVYSDESGVPDLDFIVPFAAIPQAGQMDSLEGKSELAQRAMLTNVLRLLGCVRKVKTAKKYFTRPTNVLLPLSPNHGTFGGDGLYGESKLGLETLFNRGQSENWSNLLTITGVVIGWTRGTGLMSANNITASAIEDHGVMTFSQPEMAFNVLALMDPEIAAHCEDEPIYADLTGGLHLIHDLKQILSSARSKIMAESRLRKALTAENEHEQLLLGGAPTDLKTPTQPKPRARLQLDYPDLPSYKKVIEGTANLQGMHDLDRVIVIVGYSELGPWGTARTRWEIEHANKLTPAGLIEMAWMMGLVKHHNGELKGEPYAGWVDAETKEPVHDADFRERYEQKILAHSGLRFIEPEGLGGYNPQKKEILQEVVLEDDLPPFEASKASAEAFVRKHGDLVMLEAIPESDDFKVHMKKGAIFHVPKAIEADRYVAGQLPKGFDPARYGIPSEIISQVDPVVVYALCCLSEAVLMAGLQDPLELYRHIHVSELANCLGTGAGSLLAMRSIYRDRYLDRPVQNDILQESYLNAAGAWSNMLLMASSGPIRSPTGTCATAIESLDAGVEAIKAGKAQVAVVGGSDDFQEEMSYEFGNMQATANTRDELKKGRTPREMSRPTATSRAGFVESAGCGVQLIMTADLALKMGLSIYGVVGYTHMAGDKVGRSVPAPGQGILTAAKESPEAAQSLLLNLEYRREMLQHQLSSIDMSRKMQIDMLQSRGAQPEQLAQVEVAAARSAKGARNLWGTDIRKQDPNISPMRAALAVWGLTIDDIAVASFHGTSTKANDKNESSVVNTQMTHLGRTAGNPLLVVCQKYLTGHTKGAAGALMMNGGLQILRSGKVPGNRNADNVDEVLQQFKHLVFPYKTVQTSGVKAFMLTSFGFGQKGGLVIMVHPRFLFSAIGEKTYEQYRAQAEERRMRANARFARGVATNSLFKAKSESPWAKAGEQKVFLDPLARVSGEDPFKLDFNSKNMHPITKIVSTTQHLPAPNAATSLPARVTTLPDKIPASKDPQTIFESWLQQAFSKGLNAAGVGVDVQEASTVPTSETFISRNYTAQEQAYCNASPDRRASYAGRWAAKEAVFKCLQTKSDGPGAAMDGIEILPDKDQVPRVTLYGRAHEIAKAKGISRVDVSISHGDDTVMAVAAALKMDG